MQYLLILVVTALISAQNICQKQYSSKSQKPNSFLFTSTASLIALIFFVVISGFKFEFEIGVLPYAIGFAASYAIAYVTTVLAMKHGMMSITTLIISYSLIIPAIYGIVFLKDPIKVNVYIGIALLLLSLLLLNFKGEKIKFSFKWLIYVTLAFLGNGMCSTVQKMQQSAFDGRYKNEFMIVALIITAISMFIFALKERNIKAEFKNCLKFGVPMGIANGIVNLLVMVLTGVIPNSILFPTISAGGIVFSFIIAVIIYKERLTKLQLTGYLVGTASIILLNL